MLTIDVGSLYFIYEDSAAAYQEILEHFLLLFADELYGDGNFL